MTTEKRIASGGVSYSLDSDDSEHDPFEADEDSEYYPSEDFDESIEYVESEISGTENRPSTSGIHVTPKNTRKRNKDMGKWKNQQRKRARKVTTSRPNLSVENLNQPLYRAVLEIPYAKWENLIQLLPFIPPVYHTFYQNMAHQPKKNKNSTKSKPTTETQTEENVQEENNDLDIYSDYDN
ncbi:unnamed protein product [Diabrotica balteata]|uniref:Uncharacterized protein n=1 Tax=Diabrotica balteata TaxID=107213 RepID=A0A9N9XCI8_DIABA|nr:unnamed protein product [Diabrotica balteata]